MLLLINMTLKKINILEYAFGEGGGGHQKAYAVYAFINVDNCERPLTRIAILIRPQKPKLTSTKTSNLPSPHQIAPASCCRPLSPDCQRANQRSAQAHRRSSPICTSIPEPFRSRWEWNRTTSHGALTAFVDYNRQFVENVQHNLIKRIRLRQHDLTDYS